MVGTPTSVIVGEKKLSKKKPLADKGVLKATITISEHIALSVVSFIPCADNQTHDCPLKGRRITSSPFEDIIIEFY